MSSITKDASLTMIQNGVNALVTSILLFVAAVLFRGFVVKYLWNWFIASALGAATINIGEGIGISLVIAFFTLGLKREETVKGRVASIFMNAVALGIGAFYHHIIGIG